MKKQLIEQQIVAGERARLIPVVSSSQKEGAAVSALLAVFEIVPEYAKEMLEDAGAPISKRASVKCFTEVCFRAPKKTPNSLPRPDGLILIDTGRSQWSALVEGKIKGESLQSSQIEKYLDLAKEVGVNAVITLSNQFAPLPEHHPVSVDRRKTKTVSLYHFSWISVLSNAQLLSDSDYLVDREQSMVLRELIRFLEHSQSGVKSFDRMSSAWSDICGMVHNKSVIHKSDVALEKAIGDWYQLCRYLSLRLSTSINRRISVAISGSHKKNPAQRLDHYQVLFIKTQCLSEKFQIPDTAGDIELEADFARRTISLSMAVQPPRDVKRSTASINWVTKHLKKIKPDGIRVICKWPRKTADTSVTLIDALDDPKDLVPDGCKELPVSIIIVRVVDLAGRFRGSKTVIEDIESSFESFYKDVGQYLKRWTPPPPQYKSNTGSSIPSPQLSNDNVADAKEFGSGINAIGSDKKV